MRTRPTSQRRRSWPAVWPTARAMQKRLPMPRLSFGSGSKPQPNSGVRFLRRVVGYCMREAGSTSGHSRRLRAVI